MRGIVGGMFDPIHFGHYKPALELMPVLGLSEIRLLPCGQPPHRPPPQAAAEHRWNMVRLVADGQRLVADDRELRRAGPSYTYDTLQSLREEEGAPLCLLLGADALTGLPAWHRAEELIGLCHVATLARPGQALGEGLPEAWRARCTQDPTTLQASPCGSIYLHHGTLHDLSSSQIRALIRSGKPPRYCLPGPVWAYIQRHRLYAG